MRRSRSRSRSRQQTALFSSINVTPFVDVMLVLLVVFMVTAPLLTTGVRVDLPKVTAPTFPGDEETLVVTLKADGSAWLQNQQMENVQDLLKRLEAIAEANVDSRVYLRADGEIPYQNVAKLMGQMASTGYTRVALVVDSESVENVQQP